eukprot:10548331-Alexandrium_andersonii.AAC.1
MKRASTSLRRGAAHVGEICAPRAAVQNSWAFSDPGADWIMDPAGCPPSDSTSKRRDAKRQSPRPHDLLARSSDWWPPQPYA